MCNALQLEVMLEVDGQVICHTSDSIADADFEGLSELYKSI